MTKKGIIFTAEYGGPVVRREPIALLVHNWLSPNVPVSFTAA
jgi:hypothetical protein